MTTAQAAALYLAQHNMQWGDKPYAVYNPHNKSIGELPVVYGFNNGGGPGLYSGQLIAEDGTALGGHACSAEGYMYYDLGILEGSRPDRHETFRKHYPDGYRMDFVPYDQVRQHEGLEAAYQKNQQKAKEAESIAKPLQENSASGNKGTVSNA